MKEQFDVLPFCSSKFSDSNSNILSRLQITLADAFNSKARFPEYIVMILDDDVLQFLRYEGKGAGQLYGSWKEWLALQVHTMITDRKEQLPAKAIPVDAPFVYWVEIPTHDLFERDCNAIRTKFNHCMDATLKLYDDMRIVKLKEWQRDDTMLVSNGRVTTDGYYTYWKAIDTAVKFNINKRCQFLIKKNFNDIRKIIVHDDEQRRNNEGDVRRFFECKKSNDKYHWHLSARKHYNRDQFILPRPPRRNLTKILLQCHYM